MIIAFKRAHKAHSMSYHRGMINHREAYEGEKVTKIQKS